MERHCRVCSRCDEFLKYSLATLSQRTTVRIDDMLVYCTQLEVIAEDNLPKHICAECLNALNAAFLFRKLCYRSDSFFRNTLKSDSSSQHLVHQMAVNPPLVQIPGSVYKITIKEESLPEPEHLNQGEPSTSTNSALNADDDSKMLSSKSQKVYICKDCDYTTNTFFHFQRHQKARQHAAFEKIVINKFKKNVKPKAPRKVMDKLRLIYKCGECVYENKNHFHFKRHQLTSKHVSFTTYRGLPTVNERVLKGKNPLTCPHCGDKKVSKFTLKNHIRKTCKAVKGQTESTTPESDGCSAVKQETDLDTVVSEKLPANDSASADKVKPLLPFRCDFCSYTSYKKYNLARHHSSAQSKCKDLVYMDENLAPNMVFNQLFKKVLTNPLDIGQLNMESKKSIFPGSYVLEDHDNTGTCRPPAKLIDSIAEFEFCLVLTMRGMRCCGCSMFFEDETALAMHRATEHSAARRIFDDSIKRCDNCKHQFYRKDSWDYHKQMELSDRLLYCISCEQMVISYTAWFSHCSFQHGRTIAKDRYEKVIVGEKLRCCYCDLCMPSQQALDEHQTELHPTKTHTNMDLLGYACDKCLRQFKTQTQLDDHVALKAAKRMYRCAKKDCRMEFKLEKDAIVHVGSCS